MKYVIILALLSGGCSTVQKVDNPFPYVSYGILEAHKLFVCEHPKGDRVCGPWLIQKGDRECRTVPVIESNGAEGWSVLCRDNPGRSVCDNAQVGKD